MRFSQISSLFLVVIFFVSCSLATTKNLVEQKSSISVYKNPYFSDTNKDYIYKTKIDIYGNYFGGIMIFKKLGINHHRIVFTTEFGSKIFDFEINNDTFTKNYIIDDLDRKLIVNTLEKDFKILLTENSAITNSFTQPNFTIFQSSISNRYNFFFVNATNNQLTKIAHTSKHKEKVIFLFSEITNNIAKKVQIQHKNINLNINLNYINN